MSRPNPADVLTAVVAKLLATAAVTARVGTRVYNHTPQDQRDFPYLRVRLSRLPQDDTKTSRGLDCDVIVEGWTNYDGDKEALELAAIVDEALDMATLTLAGGQQVVFIQYVDAMVNDPPDDLPRSVFQTYHLKATT